jgi:hypothetical protein
LKKLKDYLTGVSELAEKYASVFATEDIARTAREKCRKIDMSALSAYLCVVEC